MRNSRFADKFVFVEDYDINVGRYLVQGVDVWLNNRGALWKHRNKRSKVVLNGGLISLFWMAGGPKLTTALNGFAIGTGRTHSNMDVHDTRDGEVTPYAAGRSDSTVLPA